MARLVFPPRVCTNPRPSSTTSSAVSRLWRTSGGLLRYGGPGMAAVLDAMARTSATDIALPARQASMHGGRLFGDDFLDWLARNGNFDGRFGRHPRRPGGASECAADGGRRPAVGTDLGNRAAQLSQLPNADCHQSRPYTRERAGGKWCWNSECAVASTGANAGPARR